jgi:hypothetical protein
MEAEVNAAQEALANHIDGTESKLFVVGSQSGKQTKTITIPAGYACAAEINKSNWDMAGLPHATCGDKFETTVSGDQLTVKRIDAGGLDGHGWGMKLQFKCSKSAAGSGSGSGSEAAGSGSDSGSGSGSETAGETEANKEIEEATSTAFAGAETEVAKEVTKEVDATKEVVTEPVIEQKIERTYKECYSAYRHCLTKEKCDGRRFFSACCRKLHFDKATWGCKR